MLFKEKGYDEFLAQKIEKANADIEAGRVYTLEELDFSVKQLLEQKTRELAQQDIENAIYA